MTVAAGGYSSSPTPAELELVDALYVDAVLAAVGGPEDGATRIVRQNFFASVHAAIRRGAITIDPAVVIAENYWQRVSEQSGDNTGRLIDDLVDGQLSLFVDDWLDLPITVGRKKRTVIRFLVPSDWETILLVRKENLSRAQHKYRRAQDAAAVAISACAIHGDFETAVRSGHVVAPATTKAAPAAAAVGGAT